MRPTTRLLLLLTPTMDCDYALVQAADIPRALAIEHAGFPEDEAASLDSLESVHLPLLSHEHDPELILPCNRYRQAHAGDLFLGAYTRSPKQLIAYVCATRTSSSTLTHDSMATHDPQGPYVAIHSVCVDEAHRRKGVALALVKEYLARLEVNDDSVLGARLIAHDNLIKLYQQAGFDLVGRSKVVHGAKPWYELKVDFGRASASASSSRAAAAAAAAGAGAAREDEEGDVRSPGRLLTRAGGIGALVDPASGTNATDLFCPRAECRCLLLRRGAGKWVRTHASDFEVRPLDNSSLSLPLRRIPPPPALEPSSLTPTSTSRSSPSSPAAPCPPSPHLCTRTCTCTVRRLLVRRVPARLREHRLLAQRPPSLGLFFLLLLVGRRTSSTTWRDDQVPHLRRLRPRPARVARHGGEGPRARGAGRERRARGRGRSWGRGQEGEGVLARRRAGAVPCVACGSSETATRPRTGSCATFWRAAISQRRSAVLSLPWVALKRCRSNARAEKARLPALPRSRRPTALR